MKKNQVKKTRHHIFCSSRVGSDRVCGICMVEEKIHDLSHRLFGNMLPEEIVEWLNHTLWKDKFEITIKKKGKRNANR